MLHVGTTIRPGENINFSLDDKGEMYINAKGGADLPWCSGYFRNMALPAGQQTAMQPIVVEGDTSMVSGNTFVVPEDGLYILNTGGGRFTPGGVNIFSIIYLNDMTFDLSKSLNGFVSSQSYWVSPLIIVEELKREDFLMFALGTANGVTASSINADNTTHRFTFARIR